VARPTFTDNLRDALAALTAAADSAHTRILDDVANETAWSQLQHVSYQLERLEEATTGLRPRREARPLMLRRDDSEAVEAEEERMCDDPARIANAARYLHEQGSITADDLARIEAKPHMYRGAVLVRLFPAD
jgi:hypothetical protein